MIGCGATDPALAAPVDLPKISIQALCSIAVAFAGL